ncbi:MAG: HEAT repeat domain-containing protein [Bradyrhizobium sp.]|nr:HEAT repeat domain-containing protein [Bradyrhizobium sp.]
MTKARPKSSTTEQHARKIATAIAKGRLPAPTSDLDRYLEDCPGEIFAAFDGAARHMPPAGKDDALAFGYLFLMQALLERLRYRAERGYADAAELIAKFQAEVAAQADAERIDGNMLAFVGSALHQARIPAGPELAEVSARRHVSDESGPIPADIRAVLEDLIEACGGDPFGLVGSLAEFGHAMPEEARSALVAGLALAGQPDARAAAVLFLQDSSPAVRRAAAGALVQVASSLSPVDLRRLIAVRNWRPQNERAEVDAVVRKARTAGIECARWEAGGVETILATAIDGAAAQAFLLVSPAGRKKRISSILTKGGIADAWVGDPESRRSIEAAMAAAGMDAPMLAVSRSYLDRMLSHALALTAERDEAPPLGLLQVAETMGGADWQSARMDFSATLSELIAGLPKAMRDSAAVPAVLRKSGELDGLAAFEQSWFEDDPEMARIVASGGTRGRAKLVTYLLQSVIARRRDKWADLFLHTALWMREAPPDADLCWRELAIVADAIARGCDLTEIGLMHNIAQRTIAALAGVTT